MSRIQAPLQIALNARRRPPARRVQRGAALLILLAILMVAVLYGLFSSLNEATATVPLQRSQHNAEVLRQAKEALIAYAVQKDNGPGHLPCPDRNNSGNDPGTACASLATRIGRLPWRSLGIPDLRDSSGERLWYAVSRCFLPRNFGTDVGVGPNLCPNGYRVNSDELGQLSVGGLAPASNVVAVIFAPGAPLGGQLRDGPVPPATCSPGFDNNCRVANYLEGDNNTPDDVYFAATACEGGDPAKCPFGAFNDQLIVITEEDLFRAVEEEVRLRLDRDLVPRMSDYWTAWRSTLGLSSSAIVMPYAAPFIDATATPTDPTRAQNLYRGAAGQTVGLLPLTQDTSFLTWNTSFGAVAVDTRTLPAGSWGPAIIDGSSPIPPDPAANLNFAVNHDGTNREYRVSARLRNVGLTFALPIPTPTPSGVFSSVNLTQSFDASGNLNVVYTVTVTGAGAGPLPLSVPRTSTFSAVTNSAPVEVQWFFENRWYRHVLYAVSPGVVTGASGLTGTCVAPPGTPACVVVQSARPVDARTDARFALVLAGRNLKSTPRTWTLADYFDGKNATATGAPVLERKLRGPQFNDKVVAR